MTDRRYLKDFDIDIDQEREAMKKEYEKSAIKKTLEDRVKELELWLAQLDAACAPIIQEDAEKKSVKRLHKLVKESSPFHLPKVPDTNDLLAQATKNRQRIRGAMEEEVKRDAGPPAPPKSPVEPAVEYIKEGQFIRKENLWEKYPVGTKVVLDAFPGEVFVISEWGQHGCQAGNFRVKDAIWWFNEDNIVGVVPVKKKPAETYEQGWKDGRTDLIRNIRSVEKFLRGMQIYSSRITEDFQIEEYRIKSLWETHD